VLVFFVLSGYVIGLTTTGLDDGPAVRRYLARRAWRLILLNPAAIFLGVLPWPHHEPANVAANLLFLQNHDTYP
jgi:hypothetical protein